MPTKTIGSSKIEFSSDGDYFKIFDVIDANLAQVIIENLKTKKAADLAADLLPKMWGPLIQIFQMSKNDVKDFMILNLERSRLVYKQIKEVFTTGSPVSTAYDLNSARATYTSRDKSVSVKFDGSMKKTFERIFNTIRRGLIND